MKDDSTRRSRRTWRLGALAFLLTLTLGSTAQTPSRWNTPQTSPQASPQASTTTIAAAPQRLASNHPSRSA